MQEEREELAELTQQEELQGLLQRFFSYAGERVEAAGQMLEVILTREEDYSPPLMEALPLHLLRRLVAGELVLYLRHFNMLELLFLS
jgi:hypothetical protein